jgi:hypothetical protein
LTTSYFAFYEWFPGNSVEIANFPIAPGDLIGEEIIPLWPAPGSDDTRLS